MIMIIIIMEHTFTCMEVKTPLTFADYIFKRLVRKQADSRCSKINHFESHMGSETEEVYS